ncbi:MAG: hypothetical protein HUJ84_01900 [Veillonella sp.]|nr:hypothetical protein [Veillonella sp.]
MISLYPSLYDAFVCKADKCQKTCCQRWEIDIDDASAAAYLGEKGPLGDELRQWVVETEEGHRFTFEDNGYCHFLKDGLCRLVLAKGEDYLCDICHAHPRFYAYLGDLELCGVGLACEHSVELLLAPERQVLESETGLTQTVPWTDGQLYFREELDQETIELLEEDGLDAKPRADVSLADILLDLGLEVAEETVDYAPLITRAGQLDPVYIDRILEAMGQTEAINQEWTQTLASVAAKKEELAQELADSILDQDQFYTYLNRFYQYIIYRQLDQLETRPWQDLVFYGLLNTTFVGLLALHYGEVNRAMVDWSEQIEYNTDNVTLLLQIAG